jgi:hypothetical protein
MYYVVIVAKGLDGHVRVLHRPYSQKYNLWKNDGISLPKDCSNSYLMAEYNTHNIFITIEEAQATLTWYLDYTKKFTSKRTKEYFSNKENYTIIEKQ